MEVITLNHKAFVEKCAELNSKLDFQPDMIVGILNGGGYVVKEFHGIEFKLVKLQRDNWLKNHFLVKFLLKLLPYAISNKLRRIESKKARQSVQTIDLNVLKQRIVEFKIDNDLKDKINNILIVDDAIDTGKTMFVVKNSLTKLFSNATIKIAVISWTIEESIIKPDYCLFKNTLVRFPWSKDYKGKDFEKKSFSS
jgi:hypoxanthine phosphoribosyltransferase